MPFIKSLLRGPVLTTCRGALFERLELCRAPRNKITEGHHFAFHGTMKLLFVYLEFRRCDLIEAL